MNSEPAAVYLAEYQALRTEAMAHFTFANALIGLEIAAIGVGVGFMGGEAPVLIAGLALLTVVIWLSYMDHIAGIHRIALYIGTTLRDRLQTATGEQVFEWERWLRELRSSGVRVSGGKGGSVTEKGIEPKLGLTYPSTFFASVAVLFLAYFIYLSIQLNHFRTGWPWPIVVIVAMALCFAGLRRFAWEGSWRAWTRS